MESSHLGTILINITTKIIVIWCPVVEVNRVWPKSIQVRFHTFWLARLLMGSETDSDSPANQHRKRKKLVHLIHYLMRLMLLNHSKVWLKLNNLEKILWNQIGKNIGQYFKIIHFIFIMIRRKLQWYRYEFRVSRTDRIIRDPRTSDPRVSDSGTTLNERLTHIGKSRKLFPKNGRWLTGYPGNFFQAFSRFCNFGEWLRGFSGNYFQVNSMSTYPWKNIFSQKRGMTQRLFRKLFPGEFLMHLLKKKY